MLWWELVLDPELSPAFGRGRRNGGLGPPTASDTPWSVPTLRKTLKWSPRLPSKANEQLPSQLPNEPNNKWLEGKLVVLRLAGM